MTEFELIARHFARHAARDGIVLGIGDDCALLATTPGQTLAISTDMLVAGRHFFDDVDPAALGWKTLAVNLSDLAAIGAVPRAFTLALALPAIDDAWLAAFADGLFACADRFDCALVGGDTTRGPLTLSVTVFGEVAAARALRRDAAAVDDDVWLSGTVGCAAFALREQRRRRAGEPVAIEPAVQAALDRPVPRTALGSALAGVAHAAIDVSDGLAQDLGHVLAASGRGATLATDALPMHAALASLDPEDRLRLALAGGDDYELCFTAAPADRAAIERIATSTATPVTRIGRIEAASGLRLVDADGRSWRPADGRPLAGFDHFASPA
jgi:thiamine-monophosphate kinase